MATRRGDTAVGKSLEDLMGIAENNYPTADLKGVEFKAQRVDSGAHTTLFTRNPTAPLRGVHALLDRFGRQSGDPRYPLLFNTNFAAGRMTPYGGGALSVDTNGDQVRLRHHGSASIETCAVWDLADIQPVLERKLAALAVLRAITRHDEQGVESYRFVGCDLFWGLETHRFMEAVQAGRISIHFRVKGSLRACRNRGTAFRIDRRDLAGLYRHRVSLQPGSPMATALATG